MQRLLAALPPETRNVVEAAMKGQVSGGSSKVRPLLQPVLPSAPCMACSPGITRWAHCGWCVCVTHYQAQGLTARELPASEVQIMALLFLLQGGGPSLTEDPWGALVSVHTLVAHSPVVASTSCTTVVSCRLEHTVTT